MTRTWVLVASRDHARRGLAAGFVMANHGKRAPVARMSAGDRIREHLPTSKIRFGFFELSGDDAEAIWALAP